MKILLFICLFVCIYSFSFDQITNSFKDVFDNVKCFLTYQEYAPRKIKNNLQKELLIHDKARQSLIRRISYYININTPSEILKISIYGLSKAGKTFTSELIIKSIFKRNSPGYIVYNIPSENISHQKLKTVLEKSLLNRMRLCHDVLLLVVDGLTTKYKDFPEMISIPDMDGIKIIILFLYTLSNEEYNQTNSTENRNYNYLLYHPYYPEDVRKILSCKWNEYLLNEKSHYNLIDIIVDESFFIFIAKPTTKIIEYYHDQYSQNIFEVDIKIIKSIDQICSCLLKDLPIHYSKFSKLYIYYENEFIAKLYNSVKDEYSVMKSKEPIENVISNILSTDMIECSIFYK